MDMLDQSVRTLKGVGEARAAALGRLNIETVGQLLGFFPRDYENRTEMNTIALAADGQEVVIEARLAAEPAVTRPRRGLSLLRVLATDGNAFMTLVWFNQEHLAKTLRMDVDYRFFGRVKRSGMRVEMTNPVVEPAAGAGSRTGRIMPVYRLTHGLQQQQMRWMTEQALRHFHMHLADPLPESLRKAHGLMGLQEAVCQIHWPSDIPQGEKARRRLVFEELLMLQLGLAHLKGAGRSVPARPMKPVDLTPLLALLPFSLTGAQERVWQEVHQDLRRSVRMNRLIQGDVGSGKTALAMLAIYAAARNGVQSAFLAPTEILAEQHARTMTELFGSLGIRIGLLTGSRTKKDKTGAKEKIASGEWDVVIGTHALLEQDVVFRDLGLVVTDEQHRFGVRQRAVLAGKGEQPHLLVMTATPIPRTLALVLYGDLDISVVDELPPGRKPIRTYAVGEEMRPRILNFIRTQVKEGRQVYVVCPLVEENEELDLEAAEAIAARLRETDLPELRIALLHGRMKGREKDAVMRAFAARETDVLVSTTVIEVGVNVPNATLMVIENAERFGLSQLHQLRGRVGRGAEQSHCVLFNQSGGSVAKERMKIMTATNDGFLIAEKDLELRGPGDVFGLRQHGLPEFHIANLYRDMGILNEVQQVAERLLSEETLHRDPEYGALKNRLEAMFESRLREMTMN